MDAKSGKFTVNIQDGAKRNVIAFFLDFSFKSYNQLSTPASIMPHGGSTF